VEPYSDDRVDPSGYYLAQVFSRGTSTFKYAIHDTIVCSYSRFDEFVRLMLEKPYEERSHIRANHCIPDNYIYYIDQNGFAKKFEIEGA
jgi:hypothetical protein